MRTDSAGRITEARIGIGGAGPTPLRAHAAETVLIGQSPSDELFRAAGAEATRAVDPGTDLHAPAEYRRRITGVLTRRCLTRALSRTERNQAA
ncbi:hypothetical protein [Amycolatopsis sp. NPDC001319]|uniref:hypothetical protein n=1 Tax=Amycolatopsis sp. NPDC001319 TaxID=3363922 RepID=UPI00369518DE